MYFTELSKSDAAYEEKHQARNAPKKTMLELLWNNDSLKQLNDKGRAL